MADLKTKHICIVPFPGSGFLLERKVCVFKYFLQKRLVKYLKSTPLIKQYNWAYNPAKYIYMLASWSMPSAMVDWLSKKYGLGEGYRYFIELGTKVEAIVIQSPVVFNYKPSFMIEDFTARKGRNERGSKAVAFMIKPGETTPRHILKLAASNGEADALEKENMLIEMMKGYHGLKFVKIPKIIKLGTCLEINYCIEENLGGVTMEDELPLSDRMVFNSKVTGHFKIAFKAMGELHTQTKVKDLPLNNELIKQFAEIVVKPIKIGPLSDQYEAVQTRLIEIMDKHRERYVPFSFVHKDFVPSHIMIDQKGVGIIDWESGQPDWYSYYDPFYFTVNYVMRVKRSEERILLKKDIVNLIKNVKNWDELLNNAVAEYPFPQNKYLNLKYFIRFRSLEIILDAMNKEPDKLEENKKLLNDLLNVLSDA